MNREELQKKFDSLPEDIKSMATSPSVAENIRNIGLAHKLHLDKIGILEEEITMVMLGLKHPDAFVTAAEDRLGLSTEEAINLTVDVNEKIFVPIRESLMKLHGEEREEASSEPEPIPTAKVPYEGSSLVKDDILAGIENPEPAIHPFSAADQTLPGPARPMEVMAEPATPKLPQVQVNKEAAHDFIAGKLNDTVSIPSEKTVASPEPSAAKPPAQQEKPKNYSADPYREPLI